MCERRRYKQSEHFCLPGHSLDNLKVTILEKVKYYNEAYWNEREHYFIRIFITFYEGINKQRWGMRGEAFCFLWLCLHF